MEKLENLFTEWKQAHFDLRASRSLENVAERKATKATLSKKIRQLGNEMLGEFVAITDATYAKEFNLRKNQFSSAFIFTVEATCEAEL